VPPVDENDSERLHELRRLHEDSKFASGKMAAFQYLAVAIFVLLVSRFWELQVRNPGVYQEMADANRIRSVPVLAPRGKILDRDGRVIVDNHSSFTVLLNRETLKPEHLKPIAEGLDLEYDQLVSRLHKFRKRPAYEPVIIKQELTPEEVAFVESHRDPETFPELMLIRAQRRLYPKDGLAAHAIGYVGEVSELELDSPEFIHYQQGQIVGKDGLERQYNDSLMGVDGQRRVVVDNLGRERQVLDDKPAVPGRDLETTLDLDIQAVAELSLGDRPGAVVALDPRTGAVLAMVSRPSFDPNLFAGRIRSKDWNDLIQNPRKPLLNRAIQAQLAPGSTFKPLMALAGLETGVINDDFHVRCSGGASFYGHWYACHLKRGHGEIDLHRAIEQSCDVYFYNVGYRLGIDRIAKYAEMAGYGRKTGIDLPHEAEGTMPSTQWAMRRFRRKWYAGETISVSIGQGAVAVTPLQLAYAIGGIAMGGVWERPHLVRDFRHPVAARRVTFNPDNIEKVVSGMYGVVNEAGTGTRARLPGITVCGKTGTAQVASNDLVKALRGSRAAAELADNAWFVGFAPREHPEIVVVALVQGGGESSVAVPVVRDVLKAYFDKKARHSQPLPVLAFYSAPQPTSPAYFRPAARTPER
jgi:penicillin-binding protein 2